MLRAWKRRRCICARSGEVSRPIRTGGNLRGSGSGSGGSAKGHTGTEWNTLLDRLQRCIRKVESAVRDGAGTQPEILHRRNHGARHARSFRPGRDSAGESSVPEAGRLRCCGRGCSCRETRNGPHVHERLANGVAREIVHKLRAPEAHFDFGWMHVDVDFFVRHVEKQQRSGKDCRRQDVAVGFVNRVEDQPVAHQAAVHKNVDAVAVQALRFRARSKSGHGQRRLLFFGIELWFGDGRAEGRGNRWNFDQLIERLATKELVNAVGELFCGRTVDDLLRRRRENELFARIGQSVVRDERSDVAQFRRIRFQKFPPRGHAIKNVSNTDGGTQRHSRRLHADEFAACKLNARAFPSGFVACFEEQARDGRNRRQRFAAKAECGDGKQIVGGFQFAGRVAFERQQRVVVSHAVAVVGHADHALAALLDLDAHRLRAGIERVFEQFFHRRRRPRDHFARRNSIRDRFGEYANARHLSSGALLNCEGSLPFLSSFSPWQERLYLPREIPRLACQSASKTANLRRGQSEMLPNVSSKELRKQTSVPIIANKKGLFVRLCQAITIRNAVRAPNPRIAFLPFLNYRKKVGHKDIIRRLS